MESRMDKNIILKILRYLTHTKGGLNPDQIRIDCVYMNCNPDQDPDKWSRVNGANEFVSGVVRPVLKFGHKIMFYINFCSHLQHRKSMAHTGFAIFYQFTVHHIYLPNYKWS